MVNNDLFESWSKSIQLALIEAVNSATKAQRKFALAEEERMLIELKKDGAQIIELSSVERKLFQDAVAPLIADKQNEIGKSIVQLLC